MQDDAPLRARILFDDRTLVRQCAVKYAQIAIEQQRALQTAEAPLSVDDATTGMEPLFDELSLYFRKQPLLERSYSREIESYRDTLQELDARKRRVFATIDELQERLVRAKEERRQKLEYDTVAATINALPARHVTERRIEALRVEQGRLGELLREQERLLEHRISACHSVFARFDAVQEDFAKRPSMDESRFYGMMLDDDDDEDEAAVVEGVATEDVEERVTTSMEEAQTGGEVAEDEQS